MSENTAERDAALIEQVLAEHASEQTWKAGGWAGDTACACGWRMAMWTRKDFPEVHRKHVAEQIATRITPPVENDDCPATSDGDHVPQFDGRCAACGCVAIPPGKTEGTP